MAPLYGRGTKHRGNLTIQESDDNMTSTIRTSAYLTAEQMEALKGLDGRSMAEHIRRAVDLYLSVRAYSVRDTMVEYTIREDIQTRHVGGIVDKTKK